MGWTCQHDHNGYCKLIKKSCVPGMKGCILKGCEGIVFSSGEYDKQLSEEKEEPIDFAALARSN